MCNQREQNCTCWYGKAKKGIPPTQGEHMTAIADALAKRKAAKDAYDRARESIEHLRMAWVNADREYVTLMQPHNGKENK